jgi:hypothetical protein
MSQAALECEIQRGIERGWQVPRGENGADTTAIAVPTVVAKLRAAVPKLIKIDCASGRTGLAEYQQSLRRFRSLLPPKNGKPGFIRAFGRCVGCSPEPEQFLPPLKRRTGCYSHMVRKAFDGGVREL